MSNLQDALGVGNMVYRDQIADLILHSVYGWPRYRRQS